MPLAVGPNDSCKDILYYNYGIAAWYFNSKTGECEDFEYIGCGGNENNFPTKEECRRVCD